MGFCEREARYHCSLDPCIEGKSEAEGEREKEIEGNYMLMRYISNLKPEQIFKEANRASVP